MIYNITNYGAVADGVTNNSTAIQKAIDECTAAGGGIVLIPSGQYMSGTLRLKSNVELHLEMGAVLIKAAVSFVHSMKKILPFQAAAQFTVREIKFSMMPTTTTDITSVQSA